MNLAELLKKGRLPSPTTHSITPDAKGADARPKRKSVENGVLRYVSVSAITNFDPESYGGCEHNWWRQKVEGRDAGSTMAMKIGTDAHAQVEHYLKTGEDVLGMYARSGKHFIPQPLTVSPGLLIEHKFGDDDYTEEWDAYRARMNGNEPIDRVIDSKPSTVGKLVAHDVPFLGYIDVVNTRGSYLDNDGELHADPTGTIELLDWKTSSSIASYAKKAHELPKTVQMIGYAKWASENYPYAEKFRLSHGYFQTKGARLAEKRTVLIDLDTVEKGWLTIASTVARMKEVARETDPEKVSRNFASCDAYRGCPFRSLCPRSTAALFGGKSSTPQGVIPMSSLLDKLRKKAQNPETSKLDPVIRVDINHDATGPKPDVAAEVARLVAEEKGTTLKYHQACGAVMTPENSSTLPNGTIVHIGCSVKPADAPASTAATSALPIPEDALAGLPASVVRAAEDIARESSAGMRDGAAGTHTEAPTTNVLEKAKRSRRTKAQMEEARAAEAAASKPVDYTVNGVSEKPPALTLQNHVAEDISGMLTENGKPIGIRTDGMASMLDANDQAPTPLPVQMGETFPPKPLAAETVARNLAIDVERMRQKILDEARASILALYVDVTVNGLVCNELDTYIDRLLRLLEEEYRCVDIRCAEGNTPIGFGKWKGVLAAFVRAKPPEPGIWCISHVDQSEIRQVVVEALKPFCTIFVQGVR